MCSLMVEKKVGNTLQDLCLFSPDKCDIKIFHVVEFQYLMWGLGSFKASHNAQSGGL